MSDRVKTYIADITDFRPDPKNANRHTQRGQSVVKRGMEQRGYARPAFAAKDGTVLGGNLSTMEVAVDIGLGDGKVLVVETDGTIPIIHKRVDVAPGSTEARLLAYEDNRSAELSLEWEPLTLAADLEAGLDLGELFRPEEISAILEAAGTELLGKGKDPGPQVDKAAELQAKWQTATGQVWQLGRHRLACGDCTDRAIAELVMAGQKARLVVTDPPYGVSYADKNKFLNAISRANHIETPIENDHATKEQTQVMWKAAFSVMSGVMDAGAVVYSFMPQGGDQMMMMMMMMGAGIEPRHELIWLKNNHVLGRVDYAYKHEPILYAWKDGGHRFYGDFQTSILEYPKPQVSDLHPTQKPVALIEKLISNSSRQGEIVYDPFLGSGTTLIACENLNRQARCIEIDPGYCAVAIQRWVDLTGKEPVLQR